jgi:hypothetical protein
LGKTGQGLAPVSTNPLEWWKVNGGNFVGLKNMARDVFSCQGASVCVERDFSSDVDLVSPMRCSLNSKTISATVFKSMAQGRKLIVLYLVVYNYLKLNTCRNSDISNSLLINRNAQYTYRMKRGCVSIGMMNCRSLTGKSAAIETVILDHKLDVTVLTETWLKGRCDDYLINDATLPGYAALRVDRTAKRGDGLAVIFGPGVGAKKANLSKSFKSLLRGSSRVLKDMSILLQH